MSTFPKAEEIVPTGYSSAEVVDRHPTDRMLRDHGFEIVSRPKVGTPLWKRGGTVYTEREAWEERKAEVLSVQTTRR